MTIDLTIIACHMVGDYLTQTDWMAARKFLDWRPRLAHVAVYTAGFAFVPLQAHLPLRQALLFLLVVGVPHFVVDCRRWASAEIWPLKPVMVDQSLHIAFLAATAVAFGL